MRIVKLAGQQNAQSTWPKQQMEKNNKLHNEMRFLLPCVVEGVASARRD